MSTRRERLTRRIEKRVEWAGSAAKRSDAAFEGAAKRAEAIPFGQPILVGHHSERRDRRYRDRIRAGMDRGLAEHRKAEHHQSKASGLAIALERSIYDDDPDAIERLTEKMAELEASRELMKRANAAFKKRGRDGVVELLGAERAAEVFRRASYTAVARPFPAYALSNTGAEVRRCKVRIAEIQKRQARAAEAEAAGGVRISRAVEHNWCTVTFAEKPERDVLEALRAAGYRWGKGSWGGYLDKLPAEVEELAREQAAEAEAEPEAEPEPEVEQASAHPLEGVRCGVLTVDANGIWR